MLNTSKTLVCFLLFMLSCCHLAVGQSRDICSFSYEASQDAQRSWVAQEKTPKVQLSANGAKGISMPCPFGKGVDRAFWDHSVAVDLSDFNTIEFDVSCARPGALRALSVYLKSGNGWYEWSGQLTEPGRQLLAMPKQEFKEQGSPAGWDRIERVRISPWRGQNSSTVLTAYSLKARNSKVVLIRATLSAPDDAERSVSRRCALRLSGWLQKVGISHDLITDDMVIRGGLKHARLAVLCYNPDLPAAEFRRIREFVRRGGHLMVFYSADEELASLMHMRLGTYKSGGDGQWTSMTFRDPSRWHVPRQVFQESWNIRPVYPDDGSAEVIAWWSNNDGKEGRDPAWVVSEQGLWMTHILMDDDAEAKQRMLLGLIAGYQPSVWPQAAWMCLHKAGSVGPYTSVGEAVHAITLKSREDMGSQTVVKVLLGTARQLFSDMLDAYERRLYDRVVENYYELRSTLVEAYARVQRPQKNEFRGVWDHKALGLYPGDWDRTCRLLAESGVTAIFPNIAWAGTAHYRSRYLPESASYKRYGDQLAQCVRAAHRYGIEVHAWVVCWNLQGTDAEDMTSLERKGLLMRTDKGKPYPWLNPAHPVNRKLELDVCREIMSNYAIDGLHLDYIRFPGRNVGYGERSRVEFEKYLGKRVMHWPRDVLKRGRHAKAFTAWRQELITDFVFGVKRAARSINAKIRVSTAVYGAYPECAETKAQNWGLWVRRDYVDFVCPMDYTSDGGAFLRLVEGQVMLPDARGKILPGIGVTAAESQLSADQVIEQIQISRDQGCRGYVLFDLDPTLRDKILPVLRLGVTRKR